MFPAAPGPGGGWGFPRRGGSRYLHVLLGAPAAYDLAPTMRCLVAALRRTLPQGVADT